jgi:glycosyltransferase involved in cell wall biosynthesis
VFSAWQDELVRILHVVGRSQRRGAETFALELALALDARRHDDSVVALTPALDGGRDRDLPALANKVRPAPFAATEAAWGLHRLLKRGGVDVVLAHGARAARAAAIVRGRGGPLLVWKRISPAAWRPAQRLWWRTIARRTDAVVVLTAQIENEMLRLGFDGPVWLIRNARSPERFVAVDREKEAVHLRRQIRVGGDVPLVGFVGNLGREKRPERTLDVLARVLARGQRAHLVVAGDGPLRTPLEHEIRERGLGAHVSLLGYRPDIERLYGGVDLLLLTSDVEGIPGVAIEAQMAGCPVVSFPTGGVSEAVEDGLTGVVLERPDTALMAEHVLLLLQCPDRRDRLGREGRRRADRFSTTRVADEYSARLTELYEHRALRAR